MKTKWLSRTLMYGPHLTLCLSDKEMKSALKDCKADTSFTPTKSGRCYVLEDKNQNLTCIVTVVGCIGLHYTSVVGLIVHEATHVKQQILKNIGETDISPEVEAYIMQNVSQTLIEELESRVVVKKGIITSYK